MSFSYVTPPRIRPRYITLFVLNDRVTVSGLILVMSTAILITVLVLVTGIQYSYGQSQLRLGEDPEVHYSPVSTVIIYSIGIRRKLAYQTVLPSGV